MPRVTVDKLGGGLARANVYLYDEEWKTFSTICLRKGDVDVCKDSIYGFILSLVKKSYGVSLRFIIGEETGCDKISLWKRETSRHEKMVSMTFKCS